MRSAIVASVVAALLIGCAPKPTSRIPIDLDALKPDTVASPDAALLLAGVQVPVTLKRSSEGELRRFDWLAFGEVIETEVYAFDGAEFRLVEALQETYEPPLVLLARGEAPTQWKGKIQSGGIERAATASITVHQDKPKELDETAVRVTVDLLIGSEPPPSKRALKFWFVREKGMLMREFGLGSKRVPRPGGGGAN